MNVPPIHHPSPPRRGAYVAAGVIQLILTCPLFLLWGLYVLVETSSITGAATSQRVATFTGFGLAALAINAALGVSLMAVSGSWRRRLRLRTAVARVDGAATVALMAIAVVLYLRSRGN